MTFSISSHVNLSSTDDARVVTARAHRAFERALERVARVVVVARGVVTDADAVRISFDESSRSMTPRERRETDWREDGTRSTTCRLDEDENGPPKGLLI
tara:strand:+ start:322 stop:618 length:297 start_codon:yes stop_codon:yes gene_type:complete